MKGRGADDSPRAPPDSADRSPGILARMHALPSARRLLVAILGLLALVRLFLPLSQHEPCRVEYFDRFTSAQGYVLGRYRPSVMVEIGDFIAPIITGTASLMIMIIRRERIDQGQQMRSLVWLYVAALNTQAAAGDAFAWIVAVCPTSGPWWWNAMILTRRLSYGVQTTIIALICLARVRRLRAREAYFRGKIWMLWCLFFCCSSLGLYVASAAMTALRTSLLVAVVVTMSFAILTYLGFHLNALVVFGRAIQHAREQALRGHGNASAVRGARMFAFCSAMSKVTTAFWMCCLANDLLSPSALAFCLLQLSAAVDVVANAALVLFCADVIRPRSRSSDAILNTLSELLEERRREQILGSLREVAKAVSGPACTLAALFEGVEEETLLERAVDRFRSISWESLKEHPELVTGGGPLDGKMVSPSLYGLSTPCGLAHCDAFLSHSWHDSGELKWATLKAWCEEFEDTHGRPPNIWFDKVCVDQTDIQSDLQCLPIFLAGCNSLLIICGDTYTSRLWCCTELFVYMTMLVQDEDGYRRQPEVRVLARTDMDAAKVVEGWRHFDMALCECFCDEDKKRILSIVDRQKGGMQALNTLIREFAASLNELQLMELARQASDMAKQEPDCDGEEVACSSPNQICCVPNTCQIEVLAANGYQINEAFEASATTTFQGDTSQRLHWRTLIIV